MTCPLDRLRAALVVLLAFGCAAPWSPLALAQPQPSAPAATAALPSAETLEARRESIASDTAIDEETRAKLLELTDRTLQSSRRLEEIAAEQAALEQRVQAAPARIESLNAALPELAAATEAAQSAPEGLDLQATEQALRESQVELDRTRTELKGAEERLAAHLKLGTELSELISEATSRVDALGVDLAARPPAGELPALTEATRLGLQARRAVREAEVGLYQRSLANYELLSTLLAVERDAAAAQVARAQAQRASLEAFGRTLREAEAAKVRDEAARAKERTDALPEALRAIAARTLELGEDLESVTQEERRIAERLELATARVDEIKQEADTTRQRVEVVGPSDAIGRLLRRRLQNLPSLRAYRRATERRADTISQATDRQIDVDELLRDLVDPASAARAVVADLGASAAQFDRDRVEAQTRELLVGQRETLEKLNKALGRYIAQLTALDVAERRVVTVAEEFGDFIEERLIWTRSAPPVSLGDLEAGASAAAWMVSPANWAEVGSTLARAAADEWVLTGAGAVLLVALLRLRRGALARLADLAGRVRKIRTDSFLLTVEALFHTLVLATAWPALLLGVALLLRSEPGVSQYADATASGMMAAGIILFTISVLYHLCRNDGVAARHFRWHDDVRELLRTELRRLALVVVPLGYVVALVAAADSRPFVQSLGRPSFILMMLALSIFVARVFSARGALHEHIIEPRAGSWLRQLRFAWYPIAVLAPLTLAALSAVGYHYAALRLELRLEATVLLAIALIVVRELLLRSLYVSERRLRFEEAVRRREEARQQRALRAARGEEAAEESVEEIGPVSDVAEVGLDELSGQAKRLLGTGLVLGALLGVWAIWADLMPALGFLEQIHLPFTTTDLVDGVSKQVPVTLGDLFIGLLVAALTFIAAKNIPGLLEMVVLQRLPMSSGGRYALTTLVQYAIVGIGVFAAFTLIGAEWSKIQWLVAALSVGLGFGLQEIVANFISGIILLFERPIRVGDIVTIGDTSGVVSRIRIRATTIVNWDKQELLVPNKEFITGRLLNWTLSDATNRIVIPVGVAYGSDVERALALLAEAAQENEHVLADPKPLITFEGFGDNALNLTLRCYLSTLEFRIATVTALHLAINRKLSEAGIEISFPQRDVHLDTARPLEIRLTRDPQRGVRHGAQPGDESYAAE